MIETDDLYVLGGRGVVLLGKTHMVVGIAATMAVTHPKNAPELVLAVGVGAFGALISDIDVGTSESHRDADKIVILSVTVLAAAFALDYFFKQELLTECYEAAAMGVS